MDPQHEVISSYACNICNPKFHLSLMIKDDNAGLKTGQYWTSTKSVWLEDQSTFHRNLPEKRHIYRPRSRRAKGGRKQEELDSTRSRHDPHLLAPLAKGARRPSQTARSLNNPSTTGFVPAGHLLPFNYKVTRDQFLTQQTQKQKNAVFYLCHGRFISIKT